MRVKKTLECSRWLDRRHPHRAQQQRGLFVHFAVRHPDQFQAAPAHIRDQPARLRVRRDNPQPGGFGFIIAAEQFGWQTQRAHRFEELRPVACFAHRGGCHYPHAQRLHQLEQHANPREAAWRALHTVRIEPPLCDLAAPQPGQQFLIE